MAYVCAEIVAGNCVQWVQASGLLPPLSVSDAQSLGWVYLIVCITAWGFSFIARSIVPR